MSSALLTVPNAITLARLALLPVVLWLLAVGDTSEACLLFLICALGDLLDGWLARRLGQVTQLGAWLDPAVDKLTMFAVVVMLGWQGLVPLWLTVLVIARDLVIVSGTFAYQAVAGKVVMAPTQLSKINTAVEFVVIALVLANAADWVDAAEILPWTFKLLLVTLVASGSHYVWTWSLRALRAGQRSGDSPRKLSPPA